MLVAGFEMDMSNSPGLPLEQLQQRWTRKKWDRLIDQGVSDVMTSKLDAKLQNFEIFITDLDSLVSADSFNQVRKRNLIMPFSVAVARQSYNILNTSKTKLIAYNKTDLSLDQIAFRVSYNDAKLLYSSLNFQLDQFTNKEDGSVAEVESQKKMHEVVEEGEGTQNGRTEIIVSTSGDDTEEALETDFDKFVLTSRGLQIVRMPLLLCRSYSVLGHYK